MLEGLRIYNLPHLHPSLLLNEHEIIALNSLHPTSPNILELVLEIFEQGLGKIKDLSVDVNICFFSKNFVKIK
jgi:hypothetical protein